MEVRNCKHICFVNFLIVERAERRPLEWSEQFSVSLRKKKKQEILQQKRKFLFEQSNESPQDQKDFLKSVESADAAYAYLAKYLSDELRLSESDWIEKINFWCSFFRSRIP